MFFHKSFLGLKNECFRYLLIEEIVIGHFRILKEVFTSYILYVILSKGLQHFVLSDLTKIGVLIVVEPWSWFELYVLLQKSPFIVELFHKTFVLWLVLTRLMLKTLFSDHGRLKLLEHIGPFFPHSTFVFLFRL